MADTVRLSLEISKETDLFLRSYFGRHGIPESDLSKFIEDAIRWRVLDRTVTQTKAVNANVPADEIEAAIAEAVQAVRADHFRS